MLTYMRHTAALALLIFFNFDAHAYAGMCKAPTALERIIARVSAKRGIDASLLRAIAKVESNNGKYRYNAKTGDYGTFQINKRTIKAMRLDLHRVMTDDAYAADAAARLLLTYKASKRPNWECMYNIGYQRLPRLCSVYMSKLETAGYVKKPILLLNIALNN